MRLTTAFVVLLTIAALGSSASAQPPVATASKSCSVGDERSYGTTYVLSISASNTSCRNAKKLIRAYHACRPGKAGRCPSVAGYRCSERRFNKSPQSYDSDVTCKRGSKRVRHTYTQFI